MDQPTAMLEELDHDLKAAATIGWTIGPLSLRRPLVTHYTVMDCSLYAKAALTFIPRMNPRLTTEISPCKQLGLFQKIQCKTPSRIL